MTSAEAVWEEGVDEHESAQKPALQIVPEAPANTQSPSQSKPDSPLTDVEAGYVADHIYMVTGAINWVRRKREGGPLDVEHAVGDAVLGLCRAAKRFNPSYQVTFEAFAVKAVRGEIVDGERKFHKLGGPEKKQARTPSLFNNSGTISLDEPLVPGGSYTLLDVLPSPDADTDTQAAHNLTQNDFYGRLDVSDRQKAVYFLKARKHTLAEIAAILGVSQSTVSRDFKIVVGALFAAFQPDMFEAAD